jgi:hypothetical protein
MQRVRIDHFRKINNEYVPFVKLADGTEREVFISQLPGTQEAFVSALETEVLFSGARAPGKTRALITDFLQDVGQGYGAAYKGLILRPTLQGFDEIKSLCEQMIIPLYGTSATFNINRHEWSWSTGEVLRLGYISDPSDFAQYQGSSRQFLGFDEVTQFPDDGPYRNMLSTLRPSGGSVKIRLRVRSTTNPTGKGKNWVQARFKCDDMHISGFRVGPHIPRDNAGLDRRVICGHLPENCRILQVQPNYMENLAQSAARPGELESWTLGSWLSSNGGGLFDGDFIETREHCILPAIPASAIPLNAGFMGVSYDYGESSPYGMLWLWISDGTPIRHQGVTYKFLHDDILVFHESYGMLPNRPGAGNRMTVDQQKRAFVEYEVGAGIRYMHPVSRDACYRVRSFVADDNIFGKTRLLGDSSADNAIADEFASGIYTSVGHMRGFRFEPADKAPGSRILGWQAIRARMHATVPNKQSNVRERPGLFFTRDCEHLLRTLMALPRDENNTEDCPGRCEDHLPDCLRYAIRHNHRQQQNVYVGSISGYNYRRRIIGP